MKIVNQFSFVGVRPHILRFDCLVNIVSTETVYCLTMIVRFTCTLGGYLLIRCWMERTRRLQGGCRWVYGWGHCWSVRFWCVTITFIAWAGCNILLFWCYRWHNMSKNNLSLCQSWHHHLMSRHHHRICCVSDQYLMTVSNVKGCIIYLCKI